MRRFNLVVIVLLTALFFCSSFRLGEFARSECFLVEGREQRQ